MRFSIIPGILALCLGSLGCPNDPGSSPSNGCTGFDPNSILLNGQTQEFSSDQVTIRLGGDLKRHFVWSKTLSNLCVAAPEDMNSVDFSFDIEPGINPALTAIGQVTAAAGSQPYQVTLTVSQSHYSGNITGIGLLQGSSDGKHGSVYIDMDVSFPTRGNEADDLQFAKSFMNKVFITWNFQTLTP